LIQSCLVVNISQDRPSGPSSKARPVGLFGRSIRGGGSRITRDHSPCGCFRNMVATYLAKPFLAQAKRISLEDLGTSFRFSGLQRGSPFGIGEVVTAVIETESYGTNEGDLFGYTPLTWDAQNGYGEVVKTLLRQTGVNPNNQNDYDWSQLPTGQSPTNLGLRNWDI